MLQNGLLLDVVGLCDCQRHLGERSENILLSAFAWSKPPYLTAYRVTGGAFTCNSCIVQIEKAC